MEALQEALMSDQRIVMEKLVRERNDIDRSKVNFLFKIMLLHANSILYVFNAIRHEKDEILVEQKRLMQVIYEEKRKIAEDRAKLDADIVGYKDKQHKDSLSNINVEAELTVGTRRLHDEKSRMEQLSKEFKEKEVALKEERAVLDEKKRELDIKIAKLEQMAYTVNQKYIQAEDMLVVWIITVFGCICV